jgi:hypothetical protein
MIRFLKIYTAILLLATLISYVTNILWIDIGERN